MESNLLDKQVGGSHYKDFAIQPIEYIYKNKFHWLQGCAIKYASRAGLKGPAAEDIDKAIHCLQIWKESLK